MMSIDASAGAGAGLQWVMWAASSDPSDSKDSTIQGLQASRVMPAEPAVRAMNAAPALPAMLRTSSALPWHSACAVLLPACLRSPGSCLVATI